MKAILKIFLVLFLLGLTVLFNAGIIDIRIEEIRYLLGTIAAKQGVSNTFGIVAKYELIKRRILYGEESVTNYELEAKIQALTTEKNNDTDKNTITKKIYRVPVSFVLNVIRIMQGKRIVSPVEDDKIFSVLEIGYFYERSRKYNDAMKIYDEVLAMPNLTDDIKAAVLVHKAFCFSMLSDYVKSKQAYEDVISEYPNTEAGILAWKLLDFIQSIEKERKTVEVTSLGELEKAKQFYLLMDFRNSIKNYSTFLSQKKPDSLVAEARFFKGRAHEELGEIDEAIFEYKKVLQVDAVKKAWARQANRRLLMLGSFYEQQKQIADEAKRQLEAYQDQVFIKNVEKYSDMLTENTSIKKELLKDEPAKPVAKISNDSIMNLIDKIGTIDLTGTKEKEKETKKKKPEQVRQELLEQGKLTKAEFAELERRQNLAQNPYRRPVVLKSVIDENSSELRYIYNKRLRSGIKLSGKMLVEIHINANGEVGNVTLLESNMGDALFEQDILQRIKTWHFNAVPEELGSLTVNYPFEFYEEQ